MGRGTRTIGGSRDRTNCNYGVKAVTCPDTEASCCALTPCCLCVKYTDQNGNVTNAEACRELDSLSYSGTLREETITLYWERNSYDVCEFIVVYAGTEIARLTKCEEQYCKEPIGSATLDNGDVIEWSTYLKPRRQIIPSSTPCEEAMCIECECLCEKLCGIWRKGAGIGTPTGCTDITYCTSDCQEVQFEITVDEDCVAGTILWGPIIFEPECEEPIGTVSIYVELAKDEYENCILSLVVDGESIAETPVTAATCANVSLSGSYIDPEGCVTYVTVDCKKCGDPCFPSDGNCGKGCCFTRINDCETIDSIPYRVTVPSISYEATGYFVPTSATSGETPCGGCGCMEGSAPVSFSGQKCQTTGSPIVTGCSAAYSFSLVCENGGAPGDSEAEQDYDGNDTLSECAKRFRLVVQQYVGNSQEPTLSQGPFNNPLTDEIGCHGAYTPQTGPWIELPVQLICNDRIGITGTIDLTPIDLTQCEELYGGSDCGPSVGSNDCCEIDGDFEGATIELFPVGTEL